MFFQVPIADKAAGEVSIGPSSKLGIGIATVTVKSLIVFWAIFDRKFVRIPAKAEVGVFAARTGPNGKRNHARRRDMETNVFVPRAPCTFVTLDQEPAERLAWAAIPIVLAFFAGQINCVGHAVKRQVESQLTHRLDQCPRSWF